VNNLEDRDDRVEDTWAKSLRDVLSDVIKTLPSHVTLGELVDATRSNPQLAPVLDHFTVQELIDLVKDRPRSEPSDLPVRAASRSGVGAGSPEVQFDEEGNPLLDLDLDSGPAVIRRRADVPDGDVRLLSALSKQKAGRRENELLQTTGLASDQVRLILRNLRTRGFIHVEGSGIKRRIKITRHGTAYLRKFEPNALSL
jgi:predicted transcriptional regulator